MLNLTAWLHRTRCCAALIVLFWSGLASMAAAANTDADPLFSQPYIDVDEWRDEPVRHRYVHGGFKGTDTRFSYYFPPEEQYEGRFFQYITPVPDSETVSQGLSGEEDRIGFAIASGAYFIETNGGGADARGMPNQVVDKTIGAFRANAAAAQHSREVAKRFYGGDRPYGYAFGGSGGAFRTIGGAENTEGVWDGVVPFVIGSPMAIPNVFSVRMHAMRILHDKFPQIVDAVDAGGSGDPYAGLNEEEAAALREVTRMGFPLQSWFGYETMGVHAFAVLYPGIVGADPGYFADFWTKPGYLGHDAPASLADARVQHSAKIKRVITAADAEQMNLDIERMPGQSKGDPAKDGASADTTDATSEADNEAGRGTADQAWRAGLQAQAQLPVAFQLDSAPKAVNFLGGDLVLKSGDAAGKTVSLRQVAGDVVVIGAADPRALAQVKVGDAVEVGNSNFLAAQTYHRHQVPGPEYYVWDQFRDKDGNPIYPQRPMLLGPMFTAAAAGTVPTGKFNGKMIVVEALYDREAYPWQADWYRSQVKEHFDVKTDENFRLWFVDRALHGDFSKQEHPTQTVSYLGVLQQALRDLAAWVEEGKEPAATTVYSVEDGQVIVPATALERQGIQPVVNLLANGGKRTEVKVGETVTFTAEAAAPPGTGVIVEADWDVAGSGDFTEQEVLPESAAKERVQLKRTHRFDQPGTYFAAVRVTSQREGDTDTPFAQPQNLDRVRVVVR